MPRKVSPTAKAGMSMYHLTLLLTLLLCGPVWYRSSPRDDSSLAGLWSVFRGDSWEPNGIITGTNSIFAAGQGAGATGGVFSHLDVYTECNQTAWEEWKLQQYFGPLATDPTFWLYQTQQFFVLTNGLAIELAVAKCKNKFDLLYTFQAGRHGPVDIQHAYKVMCSKECLESDNLHNEALYFSGCSCEELSTQSTELAYTHEGDWCEENSARLLCKILGYCGVWGCRVSDFMCPRFEWNKKTIALKGPGNCLKGNALKALKNSGYRLGDSSYSVLLVAVLVAVLSMLYA
jgi:hypothetical protein